MPSPTCSLKMLYLRVACQISSFGRTIDSTSRLASCPRHRPVTYSILQSSLRLLSTTSEVDSVPTKNEKHSSYEEHDFETEAQKKSNPLQETETADPYKVPITQVKRKFIQKNPKCHVMTKLLKQHKAAVKELANINEEFAQHLKALEAPLLSEAKRNFTPALIDPAACRKVCSLLGDLENPDTAIVCSNPGIGPLSLELVRKGAKNLFLFVRNKEIMDHLAILHKDHEGVCFIDQYLFLTNWLHVVTDCKFVKLLESTHCRNLKVIHSLTKPLQFMILMTHYMTNHLPLHLKETELFFFAQSDYARGLIEPLKECSQIRRQVWRKFVKIEYLAAFNVKAFFPPFEEARDTHSQENGGVTLIRCTFPKIMFNGKPLTTEQRYLYFIFLRHCATSMSMPAMQTFEKIVPGIGKKLVLQGFPLFSRFYELTDDQLIIVFMAILERIPTDSEIWNLIAGQKYHFKSPESSASAS